MHDCPCCSQPVYTKSEYVGRVCDGCSFEDGCDPAETWHCSSSYCDGSGCTYPGECEENNQHARDELDRTRTRR